MKRIVINLGIWIIIGLLLLTVFVPSMVAHVPTNPPDPALDATEVFFMDPAISEIGILKTCPLKHCVI